MGKQSLVALDTDHIKQYVFATDKLKEIRGASSLLDYLNRRVMMDVATESAFHAEKVYANGGSGLFLVPGDEHLAREFGLRIQQEYQEMTSGGASITFVVQELPPGIQNAWQDDIHETLELLRYKLAERKVSCLPERDADGARPMETIALPSHPFMRTCDACGQRYAKEKARDATEEAGSERYYCSVCLDKRAEDSAIKSKIDALVDARARKSATTGGKQMPFVWEKLLEALPEQYIIPTGTKRPEDFNELQSMAGGKGYLALIYADGNGMGQMLDELTTLTDVEKAATTIDNAIYQALSAAISQHLPPISNEEEKTSRFPFDLLLVGGDDVMMVTPAAPALDIALTIAQEFHKQTSTSDPQRKGYSLSVGVVLAPVKYPFGLLHGLVEETLQSAKKEGAKRAAERPTMPDFDETLINFMTVTGSTSQTFAKVYTSLRGRARVQSGSRGGPQDASFYATLRPYAVEELQTLLDAIRKGKRLGLGRTKFHQIREAVLRMNLTTSVGESMAVLRNWKSEQRKFVTGHVYTLGGRYQERYRDAEQPGTLFPRVTFPWFADGPTRYRTSLLDFVELYDFVEGGIDEN